MHLPKIAIPPTKNRRHPTDALGRKEYLILFRKLMLARKAEEKICSEYFKDGMKTPVHLSVGAEGISVGVCHALPPESKVFGTYRNHALYLALTEDCDGFFGELYGKASGVAKGKAGSMHLARPDKGLIATSAVVGTTIPLAIGAALAHVYQQNQNLGVTFFGDGAMEEGVFWESLNFACLKGLPVLFVCEDNDLAIHTPKKERQGWISTKKVLQGFPCQFDEGDGTDLVSVLRKTRRMVRKIKEKRQPGFLRFSYFRFLEHVGPRQDFNAGYRKAPPAGRLQALDPVTRFKKFLSRKGFSTSELALIEQSVQTQLNESVAKAIAAPFPEPQELSSDLYA